MTASSQSSAFPHSAGNGRIGNCTSGPPFFAWPLQAVWTCNPHSPHSDHKLEQKTMKRGSSSMWEHQPTRPHARKSTGTFGVRQAISSGIVATWLEVSGLRQPSRLDLVPLIFTPNSHRGNILAARQPHPSQVDQQVTAASLRRARRVGTGDGLSQRKAHTTTSGALIIGSALGDGHEAMST